MMPLQMKSGAASKRDFFCKLKARAEWGGVMKILITGGAGFVGSRLALAFVNEESRATVTVVDNLRRRGSELNLNLFRHHGIRFIHGDIRAFSDLDDIAGDFDLLVEASAEPSVHAGLNGSPNYVLQTNLAGTLNCLEFARKRVEKFVFLSTSRVYSIQPLREINLVETVHRFEIAREQIHRGVSHLGISEGFPTNLPRSLYGATKLSSELIIQEYVQAYGLRAIINRCGVIAGPGQFGKVDQGVFTLWVANHFFKLPLCYTGFGGRGKQVRDLLHPADLFSLIKRQISKMDEHSGEVFNVGGGHRVSTSLCELTRLCEQYVGSSVHIAEDLETSPVDVPLYVSDYSKAAQAFGWQPERSVAVIVEDILNWMRENEVQLRPLFTSA